MRELQAVLDGAARRDERQAWLSAQYSAFAYHNPKEMPPDPMGEPKSGPADPKVEAEIQAIRRRVKVAHDTAKARRQHGS